jgi:hypothetical protein
MTEGQIKTATRAQLWTELIGLYVVTPVIVAVFLPTSWMFPVLFLVMFLGLWLLYLTPGFKYSELLRGISVINWPLIAAFTVVTSLICYSVISYFEPQASFGLVRHNLPLLFMIMILYPILSALPQEIVFRPLFFRRYDAILPATGLAILLNSALFSLAHLMYWNGIVAVMTFMGGLVFARSYAMGRNFPQTVLLHAIGGNLIFVFGLGIYFYSGNATRPF